MAILRGTPRFCEVQYSHIIGTGTVHIGTGTGTMDTSISTSLDRTAMIATQI